MAVPRPGAAAHAVHEGEPRARDERGADNPAPGAKKSARYQPRSATVTPTAAMKAPAIASPYR